MEVQFVFINQNSSCFKTVIVLERIISVSKTTTDYLTGFQYQNNILQFFPQAEGYVRPTAPNAATYQYVYNYTDHLGKVRLSYCDTNGDNYLIPNEILEENHYYPFGLKHNTALPANQQPGYKYKYNGKEYQDELGLNMYDYGARNYDPAIGRWMNVDPLAEKTRRYSTFTYALNNPVFFIDPDGMEATDWIEHIDSNGKHAVTYQHGVVTKEQATEAGYKGVTQVFESGTISGTSSECIDFSYKLNANGTVTNSQGVTTNQGFHTPNGNYICENPIGRYNMFFNGVKDFTLGIVGSIGAIGSMPVSLGGSTIALTLTVGETGIGFGQMINAFHRNVDRDLQSFSTLLGLGAARAGNQYAPVIDGIAGWATGSITHPSLLGNRTGALEALDKQTIRNAATLLDTYSDGKGFYDGIREPKR
jgi:RHS repeat-associated protein